MVNLLVIARMEFWTANNVDSNIILTDVKAPINVCAVWNAFCDALPKVSRLESFPYIMLFPEPYIPLWRESMLMTYSWFYNSYTHFLYIYIKIHKYTQSTSLRYATRNYCNTCDCVVVFLSKCLTVQFPIILNTP